MNNSALLLLLLLVGIFNFINDFKAANELNLNQVIDDFEKNIPLIYLKKSLLIF